MTDYISREAAIDAIWKPEVRPNDLIFDALRRACEEEVKHIPAADVRPVVLCRDCRYYNAGRDRMECSHMRFYNTQPDDYCSRGERRFADG